MKLHQKLIFSKLNKIEVDKSSARDYIKNESKGYKFFKGLSLINYLLATKKCLENIIK